MPYSKNVKDYPDREEFDKHIAGAMVQQEELHFATLREAQHYRARFNGYRNALKIAAETLPHLGTYADAAGLIKVQLFAEENKLVFGLLLSRESDTVKRIAGALDAFLHGTAPELPPFDFSRVQDAREPNVMKILDDMGKEEPVTGNEPLPGPEPQPEPAPTAPLLPTRSKK